MGKKAQAQEQEQERNSKSETGVPVREVPQGFTEVTGRGSLNKYGTKNFFNHGRKAQGGQIDYLLFNSLLSGKPFSVQDCIDLVDREKVSEKIKSDRVNGHIEHLKGSHGVRVAREGNVIMTLEIPKITPERLSVDSKTME